jgi:hypothetical protein
MKQLRYILTINTDDEIGEVEEEVIYSELIDCLPSVIDRDDSAIFVNSYEFEYWRNSNETD